MTLAGYKTFEEYPLCQCEKPYAVYIADKRGPFKGIATGGRRLCHVCHRRVTFSRSLRGGVR